MRHRSSSSPALAHNVHLGHDRTTTETVHRAGRVFGTPKIGARILGALSCQR
jgi:hypothetical protein